MGSLKTFLLKTDGLLLELTSWRLGPKYVDDPDDEETVDNVIEDEDQGEAGGELLIKDHL